MTLDLDSEIAQGVTSPALKNGATPIAEAPTLWEAVDAKVSDLHYVAKTLDGLAMGLSSEKAHSFPGTFADAIYFMSREVNRLADGIFEAVSAEKHRLPHDAIKEVAAS